MVACPCSREKSANQAGESGINQDIKNTMKTTVKVVHKSRVSRVIVTRNGVSDIKREFYSNAPAHPGEQRTDAIIYADRLRSDIRCGRSV